MKKLLSIVVLVFCVLLKPLNTKAQEWKVTIVAEAKPNDYGNVSVWGGSWDIKNYYVYKDLEWTWNSTWSEANPTSSATTEEQYQENLGGYVNVEGKAKFQLKAEASDPALHYFVGWSKSSDPKSDADLLDWSAETGEKQEDFLKKTRSVYYYAIFRHYVYGYDQTRSAEAQPADWGEISIDGGTTYKPSDSKTATSYVTKKQGETISFEYKARVKEGLSNVFFIGWYDNKGTCVSEVPDFTYKFSPTSEDPAKPSEVPHLTAVFGRRAVYNDYATAQAVLVDFDKNYQAAVDEELLASIGGVYVGATDATNPDAADYRPTAEYGTKTIKAIDKDEMSGYYSYKYFAQPQTGYRFLGWAEALPDAGEKVTLLSNEGADLSPYIHQHHTDKVLDAEAPTPATLYAVFQKNTYYYHYGAQAGFAINGEKGQITVTGTVYNAEDGTPVSDYSFTTTSTDIADNESYRVEPINNNIYTLTYSVPDEDPENAVFKYWSRSPLGNVMYDDERTITYEHVTYSSDINNPDMPDKLYAVYRSYWYLDPTVLLTTSSANAGEVAALYTDDKTLEPTDSDWKSELRPAADATPHQVPAEGDKYDYSICYWAKPAFGASFVGWADADDPNRIIANDQQNPYKVSYSVTNIDDTEPFVPTRLYAVFQSVIEVLKKDRMIYYLDENDKDNINDANVIISFNKADVLHAELIEDNLNVNLFELSDKQRVVRGKSIDLDATQGNIQLVLTYKGSSPKDHVGRTALIRLSATYHDGNEEGTVSIDLPITIEEKPTVTFLPTNGKGVYTIAHTDGRGVGYTMAANNTKNIYVPISQENMATFELNLTTDTEGDGLAFVGWEMITKEATTMFSTQKKCTHSFDQSVAVRPVFMAENRAVFTILTCDGDYYTNEYNTPYYDLQEALNVAQERYLAGLGEQVVVFSNEGKVEGMLEQADYVIPAGVTLLIPGVGPTPIKVGTKDDVLLMEKDEDKFVDAKGVERNKYVMREKRPVTFNEANMDLVLTIDDYGQTGPSTGGTEPKCYRKLIVEDNTTITVQPGGKINMYTYLISTTPHETKPLRYGWIELGDNAQIILEEKKAGVDSIAQLYAHGFITGPTNSRVVAKNGSEVYELMQYSEHRGGQGIAHLYLQREKYKTFPIHQYYVQNVEVPLELQYGSVHSITISVYVMQTEFVLMSEFIVPDQTAYTSGFLRLGENSVLVKTYDTQNDRLKFVVQSNSQSQAEVKISYLHILLGSMVDAVKKAAGKLSFMINDLTMSALKSVELTSSEYVMPFNNNIDISLNNVKVTTLYDLSFMAGSTLSIDPNSEFVIDNGAEVFIYDANENRLPADRRKTEYGEGSGYYSSQNLSLRTLEFTPNNTHKNDSAKKRLSENVKDAKLVVDGKISINNGALYTTDGKAEIISNAKGQVKFNNALTTTTTYQAMYNTSADAIGFLSQDGTHVRIPYTAHSAQLLNAAKDANGNSTYVDTKNSTGTYTYNPVKGVWEKVEAVTDNLVGADIRVTMPDYDISTPDIIDPFTTELSTNISVTNPQVSWDGGANYTTTTWRGPVDKIYYITLSYIPTNKAGEYEGLIRIGGGTHYQRVIVTEDYTPEFTLPQSYPITAYLGHSSSVSANIGVENTNVASILSGRYASSVVWTYDITGENADEFTFQFGSGANKLSDATITFTPKTANPKSAVLSLTCTYTDGASVKHTTTMAVSLVGTVNTLEANPLEFAAGTDSIFVSAAETDLFIDTDNKNTNPIDVTVKYNGTVTSDYLTIGNSGMSTTIQPKKMGTVTIIAKQDADLTNKIAAAEITKTITITDNIVWNWERLYFGSKNEFPISTLYDDWSLEVKDNHLNVIREFNSIDPGDYEVILESWPDGEAWPTFTFTYINENGVESQKPFTSHVVRNPRRLSVYVNEEAVYEAITWSTNLIDKAADAKDFFVKFNSTENNVAQWTCHFLGVPDKLTFTASGANNWQIEESDNGVNWSIAYPWAKIGATTEFELSLQPSTNYLRISYGTGGTGILSKITITELVTAKADIEKLYMPIISPSSQKNVVFTYVSESDLALTTNNNVFTTNPKTLLGSTQSPYYQVKRVAVTSTAEDEITDGLLSVSGANATVPIRTFKYPQPIPIQLASDELEKYYFVTSESYNTTWTNDEATRAIVMRNAVADASPYVVFHFAGASDPIPAPAPGVISFNYNGAATDAIWIVQESADGTNWFDLSVNDSEINGTNGTVMRNFLRSATSRYVRVMYSSDYAGVVEVTNMAILPTTSVVVDPANMTVFSDKNEELSIVASNLIDITFTPSTGFAIQNPKDEKGNSVELSYFTGDGAKKGTIEIAYTANEAVTYGTLQMTTMYSVDGEKLETPEVLATVELVGINRNLPAGYTGIKTGTDLTIANFANKNEGDPGYLRDVNTEHAFQVTKDAEGNITSATPLFDYVIVYGETKTTDGSSTITPPSSTAGSNAQTPCYIYKKKGNNYVLEDLTHFVENANSSRKSWRGAISIADKDEQTVDDTPDRLRVYITGFCPYASTGYTQSDEGVWYFEGDAGDKLDIYLEDCYIYSRYKSKRGNAFTRESGESYSGIVARGSGAVLLFACKNRKDGLDTPFEVTIHTRGSNLLKSHYGCIFSSFVGRAFQISSPVHIYMQSEDHYDNSYTTLTFDDKWPTTSATDANGVFTTIERTNGFLSLQKQVNNAPSIDMGNKKTVVNFRGGHVELQNACISSDNYESSLAISYRTGVYGPSKFRFVLSYGLGTDGVEGTVNFYDGTTSVLPMIVPERFRQYYLMDTDANGNELTTTSCLRTPKNTYVYGGSHCMMRACSEPTSKGGAPTDGATGKPLGKFEYTQDMGWNTNGTYGLVTPTPTTFPDDCLKEYYKTAAGYENQTYGLQSVTPVDGKLNFWIPKLDCPDSKFEVTPEVDQKISFWKASMTYIAASYGVYKGDVGGDFSVEMEDGNQVEQVQNLLYCQIDQNISDVIRENTGENKYVAPVLNPAPDGGYISIAPTSVGADLQHYIGNEEPYRVEDKVYYVTTIPQADVWINFTAPFDVEKIYVVETYDEDELSTSGTRDNVMKEQAKHNADFAAFFGVAIALESKKTFNLIYQDYLGWVREQDDGRTDKRGMLELEHYYETKDAEGKFNSNWKTADYYLYKNTGNWTLNAGKLDTKWNFVTTKEGTEKNILLKQGETYSMLFPYCTGCDVTKDTEGNVETDENGDPIIKTRDYWDYWSGKFLIFESTDGPHTIQGSNYINAADDPDGSKSGDWAFEAVTALQDEAKLMGNNTFASMTIDDANVHVYSANPMQETYDSNYGDLLTIAPTSTFLYGDLPERDGIRPRIMRDGSIRYDNQNTTTGGKIPTVGGGNDMFITAIDGGINIAVAVPQVVRVLSSTGSVIFAGTITTATDVLLPTSGIYIISGENEVQKVLY